MGFSLKFHTFKSGCSTVYIEGLPVKISKNIVFLFLKIDFVLAYSEDPDEMLPFAVCNSTCLKVSCPQKVNTWA